MASSRAARGHGRRGPGACLHRRPERLRCTGRAGRGPVGHGLPRGGEHRAPVGVTAIQGALDQRGVGDARATGSTASSGPWTSRRATRSAPSPSATISSASWRSSASSARRRRPRVAPGRPRRRMRRSRAEDANRWWKLAVHRDPLEGPRDGRAQQPLERPRVGLRVRLGRSTAWSRSAARSSPRPWPGRRAARCPPGSATSRPARLGQRSVVMIASANAASTDRRASAPAVPRAPAETVARSSPTPITPVEATPTRPASTPSAPAAASRIARATSRPRSPSPTFALPLFTTTARSRASSRAARHLHRRRDDARCA